MDWAERVDEDTEADLVGWRRYLHERPELSFEEFETTKFVAGMLDEWGISYDRPLPTGLVAHIHGKHPGPTVAFRCDLDALPIEEQNTFEFRSRTAGKMHACGHDGHTAILLGLARTLIDLQDEIHGEVRLLFQPAEEVGESGARHLIEAGALEGVQAVIGLHLISNLETGLISLTKGPIMAAADSFAITVTGYGGHGGYPHEAIDPLMIAAGLVGQLQTIVSRRVSPMNPAVVSVGSFHAGSAPNIIPGTATLTGTVRTLSEKVRAKIAADLTAMAESYARAHGGTAEVKYDWGSPACANDGRMVDFLLPAAAAAVGSSSVVALPPEMGGEDFAYYAKVAPTAFALIGSGNKDLESDFPHHHPRFTVDERALGIGLRFMLESVERTSAGQATLPVD
ncbi:MAG TPA: amidohydrolase [Candidatus Dormibacteraeota bacterium]|jgi:amidohydrolase